MTVDKEGSHFDGKVAQVMATLAVGRDGSTIKGGSSQQISSGADRSEFLTRRRNADFILIGGKTASAEPYLQTPVPVVVVSRSTINILSDNQNAHWWNASLAQALERGREVFGPNVLVEGGANLITELIELRLLDGIYLSVTPESGGEGVIDYQKLLSRFENITRRESDGTIFFEAKTLK